MSREQHWPISQEANKASGICSVCHATRQLHLKDGTVHFHGPRHHPCPGSNKRPIGLVSHQAATASTPQAPVTSDVKQQLSSSTGDSASRPAHPTLAGNIIKHIPKSSRQHCATQLRILLDDVVSNPDNIDAWIRLLNYGNIMLIAPPRRGKKHNLTSIINKRSCYDEFGISSDRRPSSRKTKNDSALLSALVTAKIEDGNIKAALRILSSEDKPAPDNETTLNALLDRHPSAVKDRETLPSPNDFTTLQVSEAEVISVIRSFPAGSSGGPDGIRPQHLLDLINNKEAGPRLISSITAFTNMLLDGKCHRDMIPILFGGSLIALEKKTGGIRPIAIGYTFRRIAAKCANNFAISSLGDKLLPLQLGLGTPGGCEAAVHATRRFLLNMPDDYVIAKLDFSNAFNCVHRDTMLLSVTKFVPEIYRFCHLSYNNTSFLKFYSHTILSQEGAQQGDPLGPLLFCLSIHPLLLSCNSDLKIAYMDDITLGGPASTVATDVSNIKESGRDFGLFLNDGKCEAISQQGSVTEPQLQHFIQMTPSKSTLLGAPLTKGDAMDICLTKRCNELERAISRLSLISSHDALVLLRSSFSAPKLQHALRASPCYDHQQLRAFDQLLRTALSKICNVALSDDQWIQASLPIRSGGLGIRRVSSLALPAFLASAVGTRNLQNQILQHFSYKSDLDFDRCLEVWEVTNNKPLPAQTAAAKQQTWDNPVVDSEFASLLQRQHDDYNKARLLAASAKHSADWLHAIPISSCGLRLDDEAVRIAVGLRLGTELCLCHTCPCGAMVDVRGAHALSCRRSSGKFMRHNSINDLIHRSLTRAGIPATKEPHGLLRTDGKRPDGLSLIPWREGRCLVWDVTVADTTAASYLSTTVHTAGSAAESAAARKETKYVELTQRYDFIPIAIESFGPISSKAMSFLSELGRRTSVTTGDPRETSYLFQRLSVSLQRFNAVCLLDTFSDSET